MTRGYERHSVPVRRGISGDSAGAAASPSPGAKPHNHFRAFLTEVGNGGAGPSYGLYDLEEAFRLDAIETHEGPLQFYATPFPHTADWNPPLEAQPEDYEEGRRITGSLVLAEFGCGAFHRLVLNGEVWFDDRCADGGVVRERDFIEWYMTWFEQPHRHFFLTASGGAGAPAPG